MENRLVVEVFDSEGVVLERHFGPTEEELRTAHLERRCDRFCNYCYHEAMGLLAQEKSIPLFVCPHCKEGVKDQGFSFETQCCPGCDQLVIPVWNEDL